jgi:hypothetical protein
MTEDFDWDQGDKKINKFIISFRTTSIVLPYSSRDHAFAATSKGTLRVELQYSPSFPLEYVTAQ